MHSLIDFFPSVSESSILPEFPSALFLTIEIAERLNPAFQIPS